jgi:hypothetical protein
VVEWSRDRGAGLALSTTFVHQPVHQPVHEPVYEPVYEPVHESVYEPAYERTSLSYLRVYESIFETYLLWWIFGMRSDYSSYLRNYMDP